MKKSRLFILMLLLALCASCAKQVPETDPVDFTMIQMENEELDEVLTEPWPELEGDVVLTDEERQALEVVCEIEVERTPYACREIQEQFLYLKRKLPDTIDIWVERAELYLPYAQKVFRERGMPEELAYLPFIESGFNPKAYSRAGAAGVWQFMPYTGKKYGLDVDWWMDERRDPYKATHAAADYLSDLYEMFGDWTLALASYNAGEGKIGRALEALAATSYFEIHQRNDELTGRNRLKTETLDYVPRFLAMVRIAKNLELLGFQPLDMDRAPELAAVEVEPGTDLRGLVDASGMSWDTFRAHNLAFKREVTPSDRDTTVYLPATYVAKAEEWLASDESRPYSGYQVYIIRSGDSWSQIASRFGVTVNVLKQVNNHSSNLIHPGDQVLIPRSASLADSSSSQPEPEKVHVSTRQEIQPREGYQVYTIASGDTWNLIAQRFGISTREIKKLNDAQSNLIKPGQQILVPESESGPVQSAAVEPPAASTQTASVQAMSSESAPSTYVVQPGETLYSIAKRFGVNVNALQAANSLSRPQDLRAGQTLNLGPSATRTTASVQASQQSEVYKVRSGDTIWSISRKFQVSALDLMKWNNLTKHSVIHPGDTINVFRD